MQDERLQETMLNFAQFRSINEKRNTDVFFAVKFTVVKRITRQQCLNANDELDNIKQLNDMPELETG